MEECAEQVKCDVNRRSVLSTASQSMIHRAAILYFISLVSSSLLMLVHCDTVIDIIASLPSRPFQRFAVPLPVPAAAAVRLWY